MAPSGKALGLVGLTKQYGGVKAVDAVSIDVAPGEFISLLGPSGSGKTTTLMMVAGFEQPSAGDVFVGDAEITHLPAHRRNVGVVFQSYALFPHLSVFENIAFPLRLRHLRGPDVETRVGKVLELVRLSGYERRRPSELSGGQQQRIALARALVFEPGVVLMDEPLGALDKQLREHMQLEIKRLQRALGMTVLYVTHDQSEALTMSDRIGVMSNGRVEQIGTPEEIYERPTNRFVGGFIGESNFLDGVVRASEGEFTVAEVGDLKIVAARSPAVAPGDAVAIMVRPEKIFIEDHALTLENRCRGVVTEVVYGGQTMRAWVRLDGTSHTFLITLNLHSRSSRLVTGQAVALSWAAADARVVPAGAGEQAAPAGGDGT